MKSVTFRLSESDVQLLESIASERDSSKTDAIRYALHQAKESLHGEVRGKDNETRTFDVLVEQLRVKDAQIAELGRALERAQALHYEEKEPKKIETAEAHESSRLRNFFSRWF